MTIFRGNPHVSSWIGAGAPEVPRAVHGRGDGCRFRPALWRKCYSGRECPVVALRRMVGCVGALMRKVLSVSVAFVALATASAMAADMTPVPEPAPAPVYPKSPMTKPFYDWTGFYIGGRGDYSAAKIDSTITSGAGVVEGALNSSVSNLRGGGQVGFDYMMPSRFVIGFVADVIAGNDALSTISNAAGTNVHTEENKTVAAGTVRGRLGYGFGSFLVYGTGGWAWTQATATRVQVVGKTGNAAAGTIETGPANLTGWAAGAGLSYGFWRNWELFGEYHYRSYQALNSVYGVAGRVTSSTTTVNAFVAGLSFKFNPFMSRY
jgi:opacity protein-like surface antigen